jgi:hypothetical protein
VVAQQEDASSFAERYAGTPFVPAPVEPVAPARRRSSNTMWIGGGVALIAVALIAALFALGSGSGSRPDAQLVAAITPMPTPAPTLPPSLTALMGRLNDKDLSAHIVVSSRVQVNERIAGAAVTDLTTFDGIISGPNESGLFTHAGVTREFRLVDNVVYSRQPPTAKWQVVPTLSSYLIVAPLFNVTATNMIELEGVDVVNGETLYHFRTTRWWAPDTSRLAMADVPALTAGLAPDVRVLDLWATADGIPVTASFSGTNSATDGTKLVDIEVKYTFDQVDVAVSIGSPGPSPTPSPSSPSPSPTAE